jgi:DNA replication and repair protein RecF
MTAVKKIAVTNIRSHKNFEMDLSPHVTVITGSNGSGKTSLIEAVYIALQGTSFKGSDGDVLKRETPWWKIDLLFDDNRKYTVKFDPTRPTGRKQFIIDGKTNYRLLPKNKYPVVLFEPDDLRLLHGSPERRRRFIDRFISQLNPEYAVAIRKYERALKQRNNLLKQPFTTADDLFAWNVALSEYGAYIIEQRTAFIEQINTKLGDAYRDISKDESLVTVHYSHTIIGDTKQKLLNELTAHTERDKILGSTSVGPHRHDVNFEFNNSPALSVSSRGEVRTIILALKFLEVEIIEQLTDQKPLILLDDVFSELDIARQKSLSDTIRSHQIIITSTHVLSDSPNYQHVQL